MKNHPDESLRNLRLLMWLFLLCHVGNVRKSKINISQKLECFRKCSSELNSLYLSFKCIQYLKIFFWCKVEYLLVSPEKQKTLLRKIKIYLKNNLFVPNFIKIISIICRHLNHKSLGRNFKKENKVSIFTFFVVFLILFLASYDGEKLSLRYRTSERDYSSWV